MASRPADLFRQDTVHTDSKGKFQRPKHLQLGLGLDSLSGQKLPIMIFAKLGHSISYDTVSEIETVQAELVLYLQSLVFSLLLQPAAPRNEVSNLLYKQVKCTIWNSYLD